MDNILKKIKDAKYIEIVVLETKYLFVASALYTYILTLHKKVSFVCSVEMEEKYAFIPWYEKIKITQSLGADLHIEAHYETKKVFSFFKENNIKINRKMATALYASFLDETDGFSNKKTDGIIFASISELVQYGADMQIAYEFIINRSKLSYLRLKSIMLDKMVLINNGSVAFFPLRNEDLKKSGADEEDAKKIIKEAFSLAYIVMVILIDDDNNKVIKLIEKES